MGNDKGQKKSLWEERKEPPGIFDCLAAIYRRRRERERGETVVVF